LSLETFKKQPLGGTDRRALVSTLAQHGLTTAEVLLAEQRKALVPQGTHIPDDMAVVILGGSNGITRALAVQLLFAERAAVVCVHLDSEKMQIGHFHAQAITRAAEAEGRFCRYFNEDATRPATLELVVNELRGKYRAVHFVNGIAAGATKRYAEHGPTLVKDVDVAFHPVLQTPDFSKPENIRKVGMVEVEVASDLDIERTHKFMGTSSLLWVEPLAAAGLIAKGESIVSFCDYDYPADDPVYAMGPLAGAKKLQRETMAQIRDRFGAITARLCYPPVATTALGAIPGGLLMYGLSAQILMEQGSYRDVMELGRDSMEIWKPGYAGADVRLDAAYQACLPEFHRRKDALGPADVPGAFRLLHGG
jgi:enoyl-[acyl-carrier protein] reductase / trans-2-enoyl-CoA reductase (NAD+)